MRAVAGREPALHPEWIACLAYLQQLFDGTLSDADRTAYAAAAIDQGLTPADVRQAARQLARQGRRFIPSVAVVVAALGVAEPDADTAPTFAEAWGWATRAIRKGPSAGQEWLDANAPPAVAAWCRHRTLRALGQAPVEDPDHGHLAVRDLERAWADHAQAWAEPAGRARLAAPGPERGALPRRTNFAAHLAAVPTTTPPQEAA